MKILMAFLALALSACATTAYEPANIAPAQPKITPVTLGELQGSEALIFPDMDVATTISGIDQYAAQCLKNMQRVNEPHGFAMRRDASEPFLRVMVASVSKSSALGLGGAGVTPDLKEAIAETVQGRLRCAA